MTLIANICGFAAVIMFVCSYQMKTRRSLILMNGASRILYVLQYILLGAFEGAILDLVALLVSVLAQQRERMGKKYIPLLLLASNIIVITAGLLVYKDFFSLLPIAGVLFETGALWLTKEKYIRILSIFGAPCWLIYNLVFRAYGSAVGNVMTIVSIGLAILRYDIMKKEP